MNLPTRLRQLFAKLKALQPIDQALVTTLYTLSEKSLITALVFVILITTLLYSQLSNHIIIWAVLLIGLLGARLFDAHLFKTVPDKYSLDIWYKKFTILALLTGFSVSVLGSVFIHFLDDYYQLFLLASLLGLTAGASISLSSDIRIAISYISIIIVPLFISLAILKTSLHLIIPLMLILFFITQIIMIFKSYTQEQEIKELQEEKSPLVIA